MNESVSLSRCVVAKLNEDRKSNQDFCDFTIKTQIKNFPVHKCLLGVTSEFFKRMFQTNMKEKYENYVTIETIEPEIMKTVIEFVYDDTAVINSDNVYDVLKAADYLQISLLVAQCAYVLEKNLSERNAVTSWLIAKSYDMKKLVDECKRYIAPNFEIIYKQKSFLNIEAELIKTFLELRNEFTSEEAIFYCIINWIEYETSSRKKYFLKLFQMLDLERISFHFLCEIVSNTDLVFQNFQSAKDVVKAITTKKNLLEFVVVGGIYNCRQVRKYNVVTNQWKDLTKTKLDHIFSGLVFADKKLFVMGGKTESDGLNSHTTLNCFDLKSGTKWISKASMTQKRQNFGCTIFKFCVYVAGGQAHRTGCLSSVECYMPHSDKWVPKEMMNFKRAGCCLVDLNGHLHVLGGHNSLDDCFDSTEILMDGNWVMGASMNCARANFSVVVLNGNLFAIGGEDKNQFLSSVEKYNEEENCWTFVCDLNFPRSNHHACVLGGRIYVIGGKDEDDNVEVMEVYHPDEDEWETLGDIRGDSVGISMVALET